MIKRPCRLFLILALLLPVAALADEFTAAVTGAERIVVQKSSSNPEWHNSFVGSHLATGDAIQTGHESRAELAYQDRTHVRLAEDSTLTLQRQESRLLQLLTGKLWMRATKGARQGVVTPSATVTIVGTELLVEVLDDQTTQVTVLEGEIELISSAVNDKVLVSAGNMGRVPAHKGVLPPIPVDLSTVRQRHQRLLDPGFGRAFNREVIEAQMPAERPSEAPTVRPIERSSPPPSPPPVAVRPSPTVEPRLPLDTGDLPLEIKMLNVPAQLNLDRIVVPPRHGSPADVGSPAGDLPVTVK